MKIETIDIIGEGFVNCHSCYMDRQHPLFGSKSIVKNLIKNGIKESKMNILPDDVRLLFRINEERFNRPLSDMGNEIFKAMAAIGFCYGKQVFCFPWLSKMRFTSYHQNLTDLLDILTKLDKIVILPISKME